LARVTTRAYSSLAAIGCADTPHLSAYRCAIRPPADRYL